MNKLKIVNTLKLVLPAEDFILTGSTALSYLGFTINPKDLDIILVSPPTTTLKVLENLEKSNPPKNLIRYPIDLENKKIFRFIYDGIGVDVFIEENPVKSFIRTECGVKITPLNYIIAAKMRLGRPKDMIQLLKLRDDIITDEIFKQYLKFHI
jgi:hypothetical protein